MEMGCFYGKNNTGNTNGSRYYYVSQDEKNPAKKRAISKKNEPKTSLQRYYNNNNEYQMFDSTKSNNDYINYEKNEYKKSDYKNKEKTKSNQNGYPKNMNEYYEYNYLDEDRINNNNMNYYFSSYLNRYNYALEERSNYFKESRLYCGIKGLSNNGNNCFLNSTIQCLKHCFDLTNTIIKLNLSSYGAFGEYKKLITDMCNKNSDKKLNVLSLKKAMIMYNPIYSDHEQHDSTIFLNDLLNALNSELADNTDDDSDNDSNDEIRFQNLYQKCMSKSKVNELFSFFIKEITCFDCGTKIVDYEEYYYLDLPIFNENNKVITKLEDALSNYIKKSYDSSKNSFMCTKHQIKESSYSQNIFQTLPEILVISLKRVVNGKHIDHYIDYGINLKMGDYVTSNYRNSTNYELFAEILHYGSANGGHKIAICKNFNTNIWYKFNDSFVEEYNNIISSNAFLLFYKRKNY
jgi:ubiquitin C-terminal hydrolase